MKKSSDCLVWCVVVCVCARAWACLFVLCVFVLCVVRGWRVRFVVCILV